MNFNFLVPSIQGTLATIAKAVNTQPAGSSLTVAGQKLRIALTDTGQRFTQIKPGPGAPVIKVTEMPKDSPSVYGMLAKAGHQVATVGAHGIKGFVVDGEFDSIVTNPVETSSISSVPSPAPMAPVRTMPMTRPMVRTMPTKTA